MRNVLLAALLAAFAQTGNQPTNSLPNPYTTVKDWPKLPEGRVWGSTSAVEIDKDGKSIWGRRALSGRTPAWTPSWIQSSISIQPENSSTALARDF